MGWYTSLKEPCREGSKDVHGMVKSAPGTDHEDVLKFLKDAELVAFRGVALARAVAEWGKQRKRQLLKTRSDL